MNLYNTVEIYVCSFVCRNPMTDLRQILIGELGRTTGMFLAWFQVLIERVSKKSLVFRLKSPLKL